MHRAGAPSGGRLGPAPTPGPDEEERDEQQPDTTRATTPAPLGATGGPRSATAPNAGMSTAEYAVGTVAACAFAAVLYRVVTGGSVVTGLTRLVESALATLS